MLKMCSSIKLIIFRTFCFGFLCFFCDICTGKTKENLDLNEIEDKYDLYEDVVLQAQHEGSISFSQNHVQSIQKPPMYGPRTRLKQPPDQVKLNQFTQTNSSRLNIAEPSVLLNETRGTNKRNRGRSPENLSDTANAVSYGDLIHSDIIERTLEVGNSSLLNRLVLSYSSDPFASLSTNGSHRKDYLSYKVPRRISDSNPYQSDALLSNSNFIDSSSTAREEAPNSNGNKGAASDFLRHTVVYPKLFHGRTKRDLQHTRQENGHLHHVSLGLTIGEEDVLFDLQLNRDLLTQNYFEKHLLNGSHSIRRPSPEDASMCHYQGFIKEKPGSWAALSTCDGVRGVVFDGNDAHYLEPIPDLTKSASSPHYLLSHKDLRANNLTCGYSGKPHPVIDLFHDEKFTRLLRFKRDTNAGTIRGPFNSNELSRYVELILVADHAEFEKYNSDVNKIYQRCKDIANIVNALYQPLNIFIALVGVEVWQEEDPVEISTDGDKTLTNFLNYRKVRLIPDHPNDNAQLLTGKMFDSGVVGKALKGPICTYQYSGGVNMDHSESVGLVATTVAHEMGHNFGMEHDTEEDCKCPDKRCIMAPSSGTKSPSHWSSCSHEYLAISFERSMDYCLRNKPTSLFESPVCGNGFVEPGEQCDCGLSEHCNNPCCNASSCMLFANATCATGHCCDLQSCRPKEAGVECRSALHECDLPEYCSGDSEYCPENFYKEDGHNCLGGKAYCYKGMCRTHEHQCRLLWGPTGKNSHDKCYNLNREGNTNGNCGYNWANKSYKRCQTDDIKCGMMHCKHFNERLEFGMESVSKVSHRFIADKKQGVIPCRVAQVDLGLDMVDPGLAPDGAKCGYKRMCVDQRCMQVSSLRIHSCDCHGEGVCNNKGNCHCNVGFAFPQCKYPGLGGSIDSGPASNPHATSRFVLSLFLMFAGIFLVIMFILCLLYYSRGNLKLLWLRKGIPATTRLPGIDGISRPPKSSSIESGRIKATATESTVDGQSSPQSSQGSKSNSPLLNGHVNNNATPKLFGKYEGFTLSPIKDKRSPANELSNGIPIPSSPKSSASWKPGPLPSNVWPPPKSSKIDISVPSLQATTNSAIDTSATVSRRAPPVPSTVPPVSFLTPSRQAPHRPKSVPDAYVLLNSESGSFDSDTGSKDQVKSSTVAKITSFLTKKDTPQSVPVPPPTNDEPQTGQCNTLPRKAAKINRESLLQLEISHPMQLQATELPTNLVPVRPAPKPPASLKNNDVPDKVSSNKVSWAPSVLESNPSESELLRIGSVREQTVTPRPTIPKFSSMRAPRPKSLPPARPSQPPPRPPLPMIPGTPESEYTYDDCVTLQHNTNVPLAEADDLSPHEEIYETIDEQSPSPKEEKKKSLFSMLYSKTKKKKVPQEIPEPLYCNIDSPNLENPPEVLSPVLDSSGIESSKRESVEESGLLSEIVSELANREPQYVNSLRKKSSSVSPTKVSSAIPESNSMVPFPTKYSPEKRPKESHSSPELSCKTHKKIQPIATTPTYSNVKPRGVFSFFKSASVDEPSSTSSKLKPSCPTSKSSPEPLKIDAKASKPSSLVASLAEVKAASQEISEKATTKIKTESSLEEKRPNCEVKKDIPSASKNSNSRPVFPPDKLVFPPDKVTVSKPSEKNKNTSLTSSIARNRTGNVVAAKTIPDKVIGKPQKSLAISKPNKTETTTEKSKPSVPIAKKPSISAKVDSGNRGRNSTNIKPKEPLSRKDSKTETSIKSSHTIENETSKTENANQKDHANKKSLVSKDSAKKKTVPLSAKPSTSSTSRVLAAAAKPKGSSHVASLQQKFEPNKSASKKDKPPS